MDLFSGFTDDQTALIGCAAALTVCGGLLALSSAFGRRRAQTSPGEITTLRFPAQTAATRRAASERDKPESERRAA